MPDSAAVQDPATVVRPTSPFYHLAAFAYFALLTWVITSPLVRHLTDGVLGSGAGDNMSALWNVWWARTAINGSESLLSTPALFAPLGTSLVLHSFAPLESVAAGLLPVESPLVAYNVALLVTVFLNFICAYWAGCVVTRDWRGGLFAGMTFGASPFLLVRLQGHFNVLSAWGLPLLVVAMVRFERNAKWANAVMLGVALGVLVYTDYYYAIFGAIMMAVYFALGRWPLTLRARIPARNDRSRRVLLVLAAIIAIDLAIIAWIEASGGVDTTVAGVRLRMTESFNPRVALGFLILAAALRWTRPAVSLDRTARSPRPIWTPLWIVAGTTTLLVLPLAIAGIRVWLAGDYESQAYFWRSAPPGIDVATLVLGNPLSPISGPWTIGALDRMGIDRVESAVWAGVIPVVLLILAIRRPQLRSSARRFLWIGAVFFVWSLGPYLRVFGYNTGFMLPQTFLHFIPIVANARIPGRAFVVVQLVIAIVGALALGALPVANRVRTMFALMAVTLVLIDYRPVSHAWIEVDHPDLYDVLRMQPSGVVLEVPLGYRDGFGPRGALDHRVLYYQTIHGHPLAGGFVARLSSRIKAAYENDAVIRRLLDLSEGKPIATPSASSSSCLSCPIRYVVIDEAAASTELQAYVAKTFAITPIARSGSRALYRVQPR